MAEWKGRALPPPDGDSSAAIALSKPLTPSELPLIAARPFVPGPVSARGGAGDMASTTATVLLNASPPPSPLRHEEVLFGKSGCGADHLKGRRGMEGSGRIGGRRRGGGGARVLKGDERE